MRKSTLIYAFLLVSLMLVTAACGATATPTKAPAATAAVPQAKPTTAPTAAPQAQLTMAPTATRPPATATPPLQATATPAPTKAPAAPSAPSGNPRDSIIKAMQAQLASKSYRVRSTIVSASGTMQSVVEFVPPDRLHSTTTSVASTTEMIIVGTKAYQKSGTAWINLPFDVGSMMKSLTSSASEEAIAGISDVKFVGAEVLDGAPTFVYTYASTYKSGDIESSGTVKLWVGALDNLPRKTIIQGATMGYTATTTQLIEYDPTIKIEAPI